MTAAAEAWASAQHVDGFMVGESEVVTAMVTATAAWRQLQMIYVRIVGQKIPEGRLAMADLFIMRRRRRGGGEDTAEISDDEHV